MASRVMLSLKPQSNCEPYAEGGAAKLAAKLGGGGIGDLLPGPLLGEGGTGQQQRCKDGRDGFHGIVPFMDRVCLRRKILLRTPGHFTGR